MTFSSLSLSESLPVKLSFKEILFIAHEPWWWHLTDLQDSSSLLPWHSSIWEKRKVEILSMKINVLQGKETIFRAWILYWTYRCQLLQLHLRRCFVEQNYTTCCLSPDFECSLQTYRWFLGNVLYLKSVLPGIPVQQAKRMLFLKRAPIK